MAVGVGDVVAVGVGVGLLKFVVIDGAEEAAAGIAATGTASSPRCITQVSSATADDQGHAHRTQGEQSSAVVALTTTAEGHGTEAGGEDGGGCHTQARGGPGVSDAVGPRPDRSPAAGDGRLGDGRLGDRREVRGGGVVVVFWEWCTR